ncbi:hypothetical protein D3C85_1850230 [compost metagenome]
MWFEPGAELAEFLKFPNGKNDDDVDTASLIGRALDDAHPAVVSAKTKRKTLDRWDRAFGAYDPEETNWKTA